MPNLAIPRRIYPRPPIVEAVVEFGFSVDVSGEQLLAALSSKLGDQYSGPRKHQDRLEVSASVDQSAVSTTARRTPHVTFLQSADGLRLVGCGARVMSVHTLAPYPGWESFYEQLDEAVAALPDDARAGALTTIAVRYIDRIVLPPDAKITDYLNLAPPVPPSMPPGLQAFHVLVQTSDPADGTSALLTLASDRASSNVGGAILLYDLNLQRHGTPLCGLANGDWREVVEALHVRQRDAFESSITDKMRELFE